MTLSVKSLPLGAEVTGIDFERDLDDGTVTAIQNLWTEHGLLLFPGAGTSSEAHLRLSHCLGTLQPAATKKMNSEENPHLMWLISDTKNQRRDTISIYEVNGERRAGWLGWHWDQAFMPEIIRGGVLRMIDPPAVAGETGFISGIAAYERLPEGLKRRIEGVEVIYHFNGQQEANRFGFPKDIKLVERTPEAAASTERYLKEFPPVVHPLVITQPETGRKVLKLSPMHARAVLGLPAEESDALLEEVAAILVDERYAYFHHWQANDMIAWDNWTIIHSVKGVPPGTLRRAQRTTILGDYKMGRYLDPATDPQSYTLRIAD